MAVWTVFTFLVVYTSFVQGLDSSVQGSNFDHSLPPQHHSVETSHRKETNRIVNTVEPGPWVAQTVGKIWPKPQIQVDYDGFLVLRPSVFDFEVGNEDCDMLQSSLTRYYTIITNSATKMLDRKVKRKMTNNPQPFWETKQFDGYLDSLVIRLMGPCQEWPEANMDEHYELRINTPDLPGQTLLTSQTVWGILRGLESFAQLIHPVEDGTAVIINSTSIMDFPRFTHRGVLLDTSRHFFPKDVLFQHLEAMAMNKYNVFHWHIVDDQSFPYESAVFPELSEYGAYNPRTHVYTRNDIREIIEFARQRGIRVIPEFDTPGHTRSWGEGVSGILTTCYDGVEPDGTYGPLDPSVNRTYEFLTDFFQEVLNLFPDQYVHLGGDEVPFECWASNPDIIQFMENNNITGDFKALEDLYIHNLLDTLSQLSRNATYIVWQEVIDNDVTLPEDILIHVWKEGDYEAEMEKVTQDFPALLSSCWYLNLISYGSDWRKYYACDPHSFNGTEEQYSKVLGGEACLWAEWIDETNAVPILWPRAAAPAERLWSSKDVTDVDDAARRIEEHRCRMVARGIPAQPINGVGYC